ncbi:anthranilate synthase component II [Neobacillus sp. LXY-1]|uniref:anthranilate synthase component II n=1 Tax=Neobacillus sp. LXY-1 TaxID=3379133 RepID=UPI003EE0F53A
MILVIDNYDSFTFNLVQYIRKIGEQVIVKRNDAITLEEIRQLKPDQILISPGPGNPDSSGICLEVVRTFYQEIPILGVCLGQQIIAQAFGGLVKKSSKPMHGKTSSIIHDKKGLFNGLPSPMRVTRYHSLVVDEDVLPSCLEISARSEDDKIMAIRHHQYPIEAVQFHPEAILTEYGLEMLKNFFKHTKQYKEETDENRTYSLI